MDIVKYKIIPEGVIDHYIIPLSIVFVDNKDIIESGHETDEVVAAIASKIKGPAGINIFDMDAVTTTSDGLMIQGAIIRMIASDHSRINPDFGSLEMAEIEYSKEIIEEEPHLKQWDKLYPGRRLFRGPDPHKKIIPVHNVVITGRASNNNSATEMMNIVTMEEILLPIMGQLAIMKNDEVLIGNTGGIISVGIGMTVAEKYGRVFPSRQFKAGETAHNSGKYAQTLKRDIPCIVSNKKAFARAIINSLNAEMVPGRDIGCSPAVLSAAKYLGREIAIDNIKDSAWEELGSVGFSKEWLMSDTDIITEEEFVNKADDLIPGVDGGVKKQTSEIVQHLEVHL